MLTKLLLILALLLSAASVYPSAIYRNNQDRAYRESITEEIELRRPEKKPEIKKEPPKEAPRSTSKDVRPLPKIIPPKPVSNNILRLINEVRRRAGVHLLQERSDLNSSAGVRASRLAASGQCCEHGNWQSGFPAYSYRGENIAACQATDQELVNAWVNSPTHYGNIVDPSFKYFGIGLAIGDWHAPNGYVWPNCRFAVNHFGG